jgi:hypothetical protein
MLNISEIKRILVEMGADRAKDSVAIWTINEPFWGFGSRQRRVAAGELALLRLLITSPINAYLVPEDEDEMLRVPHAHRMQHERTW